MFDNGQTSQLFIMLLDSCPLSASFHGRKGTGGKDYASDVKILLGRLVVSGSVKSVGPVTVSWMPAENTRCFKRPRSFKRLYVFYSVDRGQH